MCATKRLEGKTAADESNLIQKTDISTNISTNFDYKKDAKSSQFAMNFFTFYSFVFFLYKKRLLSNIKIRILEFPTVNKTVIKQNQV